MQGEQVIGKFPRESADVEPECILIAPMGAGGRGGAGGDSLGRDGALVLAMARFGLLPGIKSGPLETVGKDKERPSVCLSYQVN